MGLQDFTTWIKGVIYKMLHFDETKRVLSTDIAVSESMKGAIELWVQMLQGRAPWINDNTQSLGLSAAVAGELARLVTVEMDSSVTGSARADYLNGEFELVHNSLRVQMEFALASGGMAFKPYFDGDGIAVDCVPAWRFFPTEFNSRGEVTGAIFVEPLQRGKVFYTRLEQHILAGNNYTIRNYAFRSTNQAKLGDPIPLTAVDEWAELRPEQSIDNVNRVLFAYFRVPFANTVDTASPLGVSVYSRATGLILEADKQYSRILWEYEGSELAIDTSQGALITERKEGRVETYMPERRKRLFRETGLDQGTSGDLYKVFSPEIRDGALYNGLDKLLKRIEFACCLSYGTLSDPQSVEKTAEEIRTSKQRSFTAVADIQEALQKALEHLIWCMDVYATLYNLAPAGAYETGFTWGDGVLEDIDKEYARRKELVDSGYLKPEKFLAWYLNIPEDEILRDYMPQRDPPMFLPEE